MPVFLASLCGFTDWVPRKPPDQPGTHGHTALAQFSVTSECSEQSFELAARSQGYRTLMTFSLRDLREPEAKGTSKDRDIRRSGKSQEFCT